MIEENRKGGSGRVADVLFIRPAVKPGGWVKRHPPYVGVGAAPSRRMVAAPPLRRHGYYRIAPRAVLLQDRRP